MGGVEEQNRKNDRSSNRRHGSTGFFLMELQDDRFGSNARSIFAARIKFIANATDTRRNKESRTSIEKSKVINRAGYLSDSDADS
ncbi:hypothetical protein HPP92_004021 [Vanilla planifolia]|uniref:Uncharacterized protein n=1 Tax=Vanilla planifolia TaxID=51239 RepID=A0A835VKG9_VANPL|nr:hypothetical protein HPP92_004021 [Vanilla planifolia]